MVSTNAIDTSKIIDNTPGKELVKEMITQRFIGGACLVEFIQGRLFAFFYTPLSSEILFLK